MRRNRWNSGMAKLAPRQQKKTRRECAGFEASVLTYSRTLNRGVGLVGGQLSQNVTRGFSGVTLKQDRLNHLPSRPRAVRDVDGRVAATLGHVEVVSRITIRQEICQIQYI